MKITKKFKQQEWNDAANDFGNVFGEMLVKEDDYICLHSEGTYGYDDYEAAKYILSEYEKNVNLFKKIKNINKYTDHKLLNRYKDTIETWFIHTKDKEIFLPIAKYLIEKIVFFLTTDQLVLHNL